LGFQQVPLRIHHQRSLKLNFGQVLPQRSFQSHQILKNRNQELNVDTQIPKPYLTRSTCSINSRERRLIRVFTLDHRVWGFSYLHRSRRRLLLQRSRGICKNWLKPLRIQIQKVILMHDGASVVAPISALIASVFPSASRA
jgi:hypothetical protein